MTPRLTTEFWISAYRMRLQLAEIPAFITSKGDATAGAVLVKLNTLNGQAKVFQRAYDADFNRVWTVLSEGVERDVDQAISNQRGFDPDLWVIEVEDRDGRHLLDDEGLSG
tara:strand:+ start:30703 stop:31035 length:333 start_codon:yes stop_codon:yes gene_type:complete